MKVIAGLGNPGLEYYATRHNAGFRVLEMIGSATGSHFQNKRGLFSDVAKAGLEGQDALLVKPMTYMNRSGQAVLAVLQWYKIAPDQLLIVHDDVSLPLGKIRFQNAGGAGGQHGMESIIESFGGNKNFDRLKIGVGPDPGGDVRADYLLKPVKPDERELFEKCLTLATEGVSFWVRNGVVEAMNKYNGMDLRPPPPKPPPEPVPAPPVEPANDPP